MPSGGVDIADAVQLTLDLAGRAHRGASEGDMASALCDWGLRHSLQARVQPVGEFGANVLVGPESGPELAFYGHLDTSLRIGPWDDVGLVSTEGPPREPWCDGEVIWGAGVGVALGPTAAALVTAASVHEEVGPDRVGALVVSGGTHRAPPPWPLPRPSRTHPGMGAGVTAALDSGFVPRAVICPKGGAPGPLWEEPGSLYLEVTVRERFGPSLLRPVGASMSGAPASVAPLLESISGWRRTHLSRPAGGEGQAGADVAVGAIQAGSPSKPDLLPDTARVYLYVVAVQGDEERPIAASLREHLLADPRLSGCSPDVTPYGWLPPGRTDPSHPLPRAVSEAWRSRWPEPEVTGWRGSTDGALLRALGIPTVRVGPPLLSHPDDPRIEGVRVGDLESFCSLWSEAALSYLGG